LAVIIGAGSTVVSTQFPNGGIVSVQFGFNPQVERLYQLGSFTPYDTSVTRTRTISLNVYGTKLDGSGGSSPLDVSPSTTCVDATPVNITVNPASCVASLLPFAGDYFINSYSYSKDNLGFGQESWAFTSKPEITGYTGTIVMLRGIAEGQIGTGEGTMDSVDMGVTVNETASNDSLGAQVEGESGSVQAGTPGIGNFDVQRHVIVTSVGGSRGKHTSIDGKTGQASISIPITPVYL
jgi:hypothetical protein